MHTVKHGTRILPQTFANFLIGNATTNDLWSALSKASGQDVHSFMVSVDPLLGRSDI
jgi:hypothetical protein